VRSLVLRAVRGPIHLFMSEEKQNGFLKAIDFGLCALWYTTYVQLLSRKDFRIVEERQGCATLVEMQMVHLMMLDLN